MILDKLGPLYDVLTKLLTLLTSVTDMSIKTYLQDISIKMVASVNVCEWYSLVHDIYFLG